MCDLETSRMGAPYIYDISRLRVNNFFFFENRAVYEIMWKNIVKPGRPQTTIRRNCTACWITKATKADSDCVIIIAFPLP